MDKCSSYEQVIDIGLYGRKLESRNGSGKARKQTRRRQDCKTRSENINLLEKETKRRNLVELPMKNKKNGIKFKCIYGT